MQPGAAQAGASGSLNSASANSRRITLWSLAFLIAIFSASDAHGQAPQTSPSTKSTASPHFASIDAIMQKAVDTGQIPGGVVLIGHDGNVVYRKAFGLRSVEPIREPMTPDTIFDLASLTKCVATTTSIMKLVQEGKVRLNEPVATYLPEFSQNGKGDITIRELMTHYSGLAPDIDLLQQWHGRADRICHDHGTEAHPPSRHTF